MNFFPPCFSSHFYGKYNMVFSLKTNKKTKLKKLNNNSVLSFHRRKKISFSFLERNERYGGWSGKLPFNRLPQSEFLFPTHPNTVICILCQTLPVIFLITNNTLIVILLSYYYCNNLFFCLSFCSFQNFHIPPFS